MTYETLIAKIDEIEVQSNTNLLATNRIHDQNVRNDQNVRKAITQAVHDFFDFSQLMLKRAQKKGILKIAREPILLGLEETITNWLTEHGLIEEAREYAGKYKALIEQYIPNQN